MTLTKCNNCGNETPANTTPCSHCGNPIKKESLFMQKNLNWGCVTIASIYLIILVILLLGVLLL